MHYVTETKVSSLTRIYRDRVLPRPGEVLVEPGDRVESTQIVARTNIASDFRIVAVARLLRIPPEEAEEALQVSLGDTVHRGDVIARQPGLLGHSVRSPIDGVMTAMGGGRILIEAQPVPFELHAHIPGRVVDVQGDERVSIETSGAVVQGAWGCGGEGIGVLKRMSHQGNQLLEASAIDPSSHGGVLFAGTLLDREPLARAEDVEARGLIVGGLAPELLPAARRLPFPVIVTDGFGDLGMLDEIFNLLKKHDGSEASINGETAMRWEIKRPEIIIPMRNATPSVAENEGYRKLEARERVRIVRAPHLGSVGRIVEIPPHARRIATGARVLGARVEIGQDEPVFVPLVNLEILR